MSFIWHKYISLSKIILNIYAPMVNITIKVMTKSPATEVIGFTSKLPQFVDSL
ncbi:hypothetical protein RchiOBHm_Chr2g0125841 [Rosa chinensis]|uniref:Uncharacterized protein n=1 Tax=Rosa chinensis TaxID=74649 RepID=A0A2P6RTQ5_ROSCH|nr:hypothetical protein RchiOBHm_Chr2g0125841 [Rosa chinensis]